MPADMQAMFDGRVQKVLQYLKKARVIRDENGVSTVIADAIGMNPAIAGAVLGHMISMNMIAVKRSRATKMSETTGKPFRSEIISEVKLLPTNVWRSERPDIKGELLALLEKMGPVYDENGYVMAKLIKMGNFPYSSSHIRLLLQELEAEKLIHRAILHKRTYCVASTKHDLIWPDGKKPEEKPKRYKNTPRGEDRLPRTKGVSKLSHEELLAHRRELSRQRKIKRGLPVKPRPGELADTVFGVQKDEEPREINVPNTRPNLSDELDYDQLALSLLKQTSQILVAGGSEALAELQAEANALTEENVELKNSLRRAEQEINGLKAELKKKAGIGQEHKQAIAGVLFGNR